MQKFRHLAFAASLALSGTLACAALPTQIEADKQMLIATAALEAKDWAAAVAAFKRAEETGVNTLPEVFLYLFGRTLNDNNNPASAKLYLERYLSKYGTSGKFYTPALEQLIRAEKLQAVVAAADLRRRDEEERVRLKQSREKAQQEQAAQALAERQRAEAAAQDALVQTAAMTRSKADAGDVASMMLLSRLYREGRGLPRSAEQAAIWMRLASEAGDAGAMAAMAELHEMGKGVPKDLAQAFALFTRSAALGDAAGMGGLAAMYNNGTGTPKNAALSVEWARKGAAAGSGRAILNMSVNTREGTGGLALDLAESDRLLDHAMEAGEIRAVYLKGVLLTFSTPPADAPRGVALMQRAYDAGLARAAIGLGTAYQQGQGVPANDEKALAFYRVAAAEGDASSINSLGVFTVQGRGGLAADPARGFQFYREAAAMGNEMAIQNLQRNGQPVPPRR